MNPPIITNRMDTDSPNTPPSDNMRLEISLLKISTHFRENIAVCNTLNSLKIPNLPLPPFLLANHKFWIVL